MIFWNVFAGMMVSFLLGILFTMVRYRNIIKQYDAYVNDLRQEIDSQRKVISMYQEMEKEWKQETSQESRRS